MATKVMLLSEQTLKNESVLQDNVDMKVVSPTIYDVQNVYILPILGTALYNEIIGQVRDNTLTTPNRDLIEIYILPTMIWYVRYELPLNMNYKYFNKSVGTQNADNMNPAPMDELQKVMDRAKDKAEWYATRLTKFLLSNQTTYPLFLNQPNANIDTIFANRTNYTSGMVLDRTNCCMGQYNFQNIRIAPADIRNCNDCD